MYLYHELALATRAQGRFDDAEAWNLKALALAEELGDKAVLGSACSQLGEVAQAQGRFDDAIAWYLRALTVTEELENLSAKALTFHRLGKVALQDKRYGDAETWYLNSFAIHKELNEKPQAAATLGILAEVAEAQGQLDRALNLTIRFVALSGELPAHVSSQLGRLAAGVGIHSLEESWQEIVGSPLPVNVRDNVTSWQARSG